MNEAAFEVTLEISSVLHKLCALIYDLRFLYMTLVIANMEKGIILPPERASAEISSRRTSQDVSPSDTTEEAQISESGNSSQEVDEDYHYITGIKLVTLIACITVIIFLIMLDQFIIATVATHYSFCRFGVRHADIPTGHPPYN